MLSIGLIHDGNVFKNLYAIIVQGQLKLSPTNPSVSQSDFLKLYDPNIPKLQNFYEALLNEVHLKAKQKKENMKYQEI
jgi:hypothetical protein